MNNAEEAVTNEKSIEKNIKTRRGCVLSQGIVLKYLEKVSRLKGDGICNEKKFLSF